MWSFKGVEVAACESASAARLFIDISQGSELALQPAPLAQAALHSPFNPNRHHDLAWQVLRASALQAACLLFVGVSLLLPWQESGVDVWEFALARQVRCWGRRSLTFWQPLLALGWSTTVRSGIASSGSPVIGTTRTVGYEGSKSPVSCTTTAGLSLLDSGGWGS